ncbi:sigma-54-dependent transcriptional regulator [Candidatus Nitrotoga sp. M5]|uniref:sigma-54-dependent transcriptional regulator n=1 Tax=Candidatus Nitrotoga sp. M5 TaxID=2890409 RepID=UPI001EF4C0F1|nr:sigma-54 dependent transcriptional regulator [Candidatus Nitrotoga sp. M5]CAH1387472.1 Response regulator protein PilR [Candidatus Nitrotoga sp. M5]
MNVDMPTNTARVLVVDDEPDILELIELALLRMGLQVDRASNVHEALQQLTNKTYQLCLTDMRLPDGDGLEVVQYITARNIHVPVAVITAHGNMENAIFALKAGAFDYLAKPVALTQLRALVNAVLQLPPPSTSVRKGVRILLGRSQAMEKVRDLIDRVARSQAPVHISGESGSGKELAARLIVEKSARRDQPFISVNCGAIPETLMESEFFGYRKGAFTGAEKDRDGLFQAANGGTLFLDEVADLPLSMQVKLLRVIQEKKVRKLGATQEEPVDVRIISATHSALAEQVQQGKFRQDLYYRLNVITLLMPPLRAMRDDIAEVASQFLTRLCGDMKVEFASTALKALQQYDFPGNVRELENIIERALALCSDGIIMPADLQLTPIDINETVVKSNIAGKYPLTDYLDGVERAAILEALQQTNFNRTAAAKMLGVTFRALRYRMDRLDITDKDDKH